MSPADQRRPAVLRNLYSESSARAARHAAEFRFKMNDTVLQVELS